MVFFNKEDVTKIYKLLEIINQIPKINSVRKEQIQTFNQYQSTYIQIFFQKKTIQIIFDQKNIQKFKILSEKYIILIQKLFNINNKSLTMNINDIPNGMSSYLFESSPFSPYYYPQQSQSQNMTPIQMNMIYLMQQNILLQQQLLKRRQETSEAQHPSHQQKKQKTKTQDEDSGEQYVLSQDSQVQLPKHTQQTETTLKQNFNKKKKIKKIKGQRNQTKNIPKNYGKAIVTFIQSNKQLVRRVVSKFPSITFTNFMALLRSRKKRINSIADLRSFWLQAEQQDFPRITRILSNIFLRFYSLQYIFNSRISNYTGHVKYRGRLVQALKNPRIFTSIKQY